MEHLVGYRFHPTDAELMDYYLTNKILGTNTWIVHEAMSELDICDFDPWDLRSLSKIRTKDAVWYFLCPRETTNPRRKGTKRMTRSGYWKATGTDRKIKGKGSSGEIGVKKTLVFYLGRVPNGVRTPYIMHEYHSSLLSPHQKTYVLCKVKYKGEDADISSANAGEPSQSLASNLNNVETNTASVFDFQGQSTPESFYGISENDLLMPLNDQTGLSPSEVQNFDKFHGNSNMQQLQTQNWTENENEFASSLNHLDQDDWNYLFDDQNMHMQENYSSYRPPKTLTGVYVDTRSDSDAESVSAKSYQETSSPVDSVVSSNEHHHVDLDGLQVSKILSSDHREVDSVGGKAPRGKYDVGEAPGQPTRLRLLGRQAVPLKQEVGKAAAPPERKMARETNTSAVTAEMTMKKKKGWFILQDVVEKSCECPPYIHLSNVVIGVILFLALVCEIISIR